jgi:hypothetical protein
VSVTEGAVQWHELMLTVLNILHHETSMYFTLYLPVVLWERSTDIEKKDSVEKFCSRYSDWLGAGRPKGRSSSPDRVKNFLFSTSSRPALRSTQPPIQWVPGALSHAVKRLGRESDNSPPASAMSRKRGSIHPLPHTPSWRSA